MFDLRYVKKLVEMLEESSCDSIEISTEKGQRIKVTKGSGVPYHSPIQAAAVTPIPVVVPAGPELRTTPAGGIAAPIEVAAPAKVESPLAEVKSPMVGTFYAAPEPGAKPFVAVGARVAKGQVLCIIEAMKIMNEIESEVAGVVREVAVADAHPVEYGQVLFRIDPNG
jgi:acetyl-CoA carboxylase biotin carboxyl carrier protein